MGSIKIFIKIEIENGSIPNVILDESIQGINKYIDSDIAITSWLQSDKLYSRVD
jgi:hypothetical protein